MSRAQIKVEANEKIAVDGQVYRVAEHPALPGIPYVQRGARGFVIQLIAPGGERMALKYFKLKYRVPDLVNVAEALRHYADLPGLRAALRTVFTRASHADLLLRYPALEYGMMMPWLPGATWYDLVTTKTALAPQEGVRLAQATSQILAGLEEKGLAHCDVAGANVLVERRAARIELVDIEEFFGPDQPKPVELPAGQDGYQHRTSRERGQWAPEGDRFGAAVLLAEMLGWPDGRIRQNSADEHYFSAAEMQDGESPRYRLLLETLRDEYGQPVADLFEAAWRSASLAECPSLSDWRGALGPIKVEAKAPQAVASPVVSGRRAIVVLPPGTPTPKPAPAGNTGNPARVDLTGARLCRNCGAQNAAAESFCKRCGFYIGTGARRVQVIIPVDPALKSQYSAPAQPPGPAQSAGTQPQPVPLQRDPEEIVSARRIGNPGQGMRRVEAPPKARDPHEEANAGSWFVLAFILAFVMFVILMALLRP